MTSIFFAVEKPNSPYDFYRTTEDPVKCVTLRVKNIERETPIDGRDWLIADKLLNRLPLPEDVALYSMTFQNTQDQKNGSKDFVGHNVIELSALNTDKIDNLTLEVQLHNWVPPGATLCISIELQNRMRVQGGCVGLAMVN
jgi:hypothetical protein